MEVCMKTVSLLFIIFVMVPLSAMTLLSESFSNPPNIPAGWSASGPNPNVWTITNTNYAGGSSGELMLYWSPAAVGISRFISPEIDTRLVHDMSLSFRHQFFDWSGNTNMHTIGVQISNDGVNWTTLWSVTTSSDITATQVNVPISYALGKSQTTRVAFFFEGNNYDIDRWNVDDVLLTYTDTLGDGLWPTGTHEVIGNLIIPDGQTLELVPGTEVKFSANRKLIVQGRLLSQGTESQPVVLKMLGSVGLWSGVHFDNISPANDSTLVFHTRISTSNSCAVNIENCGKIRLSNCTFEYNYSGSISTIYAENSSFILEHSEITNNTTSSEVSALGIIGGNPIVRHCEFVANSSQGLGSTAVYITGCDLTQFHDNIIGDNYREISYDSIGMIVDNCIGTLRNMIIACNYGTGLWIGENAPILIDHCNIAYNGRWTGSGIYVSGNLTIRNSIIWGNNQYGIYNTSPTPDNILIYFSCMQNGSSGVGIGGMYGSNFISSISQHPLFTPSITGDIASVYLTDWKLQYNSPCINTADPTEPPNEDGTRTDMGVYQRRLLPIITKAVDFTPDQGHQLDLCWKASDIDESFNPQSYYSVWRQGTPSRLDNVLWISEPSQAQDALAQGRAEIWWRNQDRTWYFLNQVPALCFGEYGLVVPTPADSSASALNAYDYMVVYQNLNGYWISGSDSGYSVDNIPPAAPALLNLQQTGQNQLRLAWAPVTEGIWEGNSYPEINRITYKVYAGESPDFPLDAGHYITSTTSPQLVVNGIMGARKFFRIIASDSE